MQYLAAYTLASLSGKEPTEDTINAILNATGKPVDAAQVKDVVSKLKGKKIEQLISKGQSKVGSVGGAPAAGKAKEQKKAQPKKEEKKPEPKKQEKAPEPEPAEEEDFNLDLFG